MRKMQLIDTLTESKEEMKKHLPLQQNYSCFGDEFPEN